MDAIRGNPLVLVTGETGSGKTTQLPKICLAAGRGKRGLVGCCQPRRIAAISVASRVSEELGPAGRNLVGYQIRFSHKVGPKTRIKFMTDGILLAEAQYDPLLRAYDTVILDEAHERSINIDLIAGILKRVLKVRQDLRVIVTSATLEVEKFKEFFNNPPLFEVPGRSYPVEIIYERESWYRDPKNIDLSEKVATACEMIRGSDPFGDILVFLPTESHIFETLKLLRSRFSDDCTILPLFGRLAPKKQALIFKPAKGQKIILATNIAETSITVPGIRYVVDSGLARISNYNVNTHTRGLPVVKIAKANAMQRAGRAGRVQKGLCIRLYSEDDFLSRDEFTPPEINRCNLAEVILRILNMGLGPVEKFPFIDPPKPAALKEGLHTLVELGAIDSQGNLTSRGKKMARMPLDPRLARIIFQAQKEGCLNEILVIVSALSVQDIWSSYLDADPQAVSRGKTLRDESSDFLTFLKVWTEINLLKKEGASKRQIRRFCTDHLLSYQRIMEWQDVFNQIGNMCRELGICKTRQKAGNIPLWTNQEELEARKESVHKSILAGFLGHAACKKVNGPGYSGAKGKEIFIFPGSALFKKGPQWIVSAEQVRTSKLFARTVAPINPAWIEELAPQLCKYSYFEPSWDASRGEAVVKEKVTFYGMTIVPSRNRSLKSVDKALARKIFIEEGLATCELKFHYDFNQHNKRLISEIEEAQRKKRVSGGLSDPEILYDFFHHVLSYIEKKAEVTISDEHGLRKALRKKRWLEKRLRLTRKLLEEKLLSSTTEELYPGKLEVDGQILPLLYRYNPGTEDDGIHVRIPLVLLAWLDQEPFTWLVPGFLSEKILFLLRGLPKAKKKMLEPLDETASKLVKVLEFQRGNLRSCLAEELNRSYGVILDENEFLKEEQLPPHLVMHFEVVDQKGNLIIKGNDLFQLKKRLSDKCMEAINSWKKFQYLQGKICRAIGPDDLSGLPGRVTVGQWGEVTIYAYLALCSEGEEVRSRLMLSKKNALKESKRGLSAILASLLKKEIKHLKNSIHTLLSQAFSQIKREYPFKSKKMDEEIKILKEKFYLSALSRQFPDWNEIPDSKRIRQEASRIKSNWSRFCLKWLELTGALIKAYVSLRRCEERLFKRYPDSRLLKEALDSVDVLKQAILDGCLMAGSSEEFLIHAPRYLKALEIRLERATNQINKDKAKWNRFFPIFQTYYHIVSSNKAFPYSQDSSFQEFQTLVFEFMVSVFAPELAIRGRSSEKRLLELNSYFQKRF